MIQLLDEYCNTLYVNKNHIIKITFSEGRTDIICIHLSNGTSFRSKSTIHQVLKFIEDVGGIQ